MDELRQAASDNIPTMPSRRKASATSGCALLGVHADRDIRAGEELTYDHNTNGDAGIPCKCRPGCRHVI